MYFARLNISLRKRGEILQLPLTFSDSDTKYSFDPGTGDAEPNGDALNGAALKGAALNGVAGFTVDLKVNVKSGLGLLQTVQKDADAGLELPQ